MELFEAIKTRKSVRGFSDRQVSQDEVLAILEAARLSQSWGNTQCWEIIVVRDHETINSIGSFASERNPARRCLLSASVLLVFCAKNFTSGCRDGIQRTKFSEWFMFDIGVAVENVCLAVHAMGLGTVVVGAIDHDACAKVLAVPEGFEVVVLLPLGFPADSSSGSTGRKKLSSFVHYEKFGNLKIEG